MTGIRDKLPPINYVAVYRLPALKTTQPVELVRSDVVTAVLTPGPIKLTESVALLHHGPGVAGMTGGKQRIDLDGGPYLFVSTLQGFDSDVRGDGQRLVAEWSALTELCSPSLIVSKEFEGVVARPGEFVVIPEDPVRLTALPAVDAAVIATELSAAYAKLCALSAENRGRFQLASRWFRRGQETVNWIDRLLFWYIALEVYPAEGRIDVPRYVGDVLHRTLYPEVSPRELKVRVGIGHIAGIRADIVHSGKTRVDDAEQEEFEQRLDQLDAICRTCLRLLCGLEPGNVLDRWVRPNVAA